jgi:hypothetical protein
MSSERSFDLSVSFVFFPIYHFHNPDYTFGARVAQWVRSLYLTTRTSLSPIRRGFAPGFVNYKKGCTQIVVASDKAYRLLAHGRWFSPASSTTKAGRYDIAEILLIVALKHLQSKSKTDYTFLLHFLYELFLLRRTTSVSFSMLERWKWKKMGILLKSIWQHNCNFRWIFVWKPTRQSYIKS